MKYRKINGLGEHVSVLCMGAGPLHFKQEEAGRTKLDVFIENDGNLFDTANIYGKWLESGKNESEIVLGNWLYDRTVKSHARARADFFISTREGIRILRRCTFLVSPKRCSDRIWRSRLRHCAPTISISTGYTGTI